MIYFIGNKEQKFVKIGQTRLGNLKSRMNVLQTSCPYHLTVFKVIEGNLEDEKLLHKTFKSKQMKGEWFKLDEEIESFISMIPECTYETGYNKFLKGIEKERQNLTNYD